MNLNEILLCLHLFGASVKSFPKLKYDSSPDLAYFSQIINEKEWSHLIGRSVEIIKYCETNNINICFIGDPNYPQALQSLADAPLLLFSVGNLQLLKNKSISMVGTREPSLLTKLWVKEIAAFISSQGYTTVSGMAQGVDTVVHENSLNSGTIAVIAQGVDCIYPASNHHLFAKAKSTNKFLILSEYAPGIKPMRYHFPKRNRLIAALSDNIIFCEGGLKSGALISIQWADRLNKQIYFSNYKEQNNNEGIKKVSKYNNSVDLSQIFPLEYKEHEFILNAEYEKYSYIGNQTWVKFSIEPFSSKSFLPGLLDQAV